MDVNVVPLPEGLRGHSLRFLPCPPPVFPNSGPDGPTPAQVELALALFRALDPESQAWYRANMPTRFGDVE